MKNNDSSLAHVRKNFKYIDMFTWIPMCSINDADVNIHTQMRKIPARHSAREQVPFNATFGAMRHISNFKYRISIILCIIVK